MGGLEGYDRIMPKPRSCALRRGVRFILRGAVASLLICLIIVGFLIQDSFRSIPPMTITKDKETVVLLHGIARTGRSMNTIEADLRKEGYQTVNITYPSTTQNLDAIVETLRGGALSDEFWAAAGEVHFVTHSMGGLVARRYLEKYPEGNVRRVVMLGPPNKGSAVADFISGWEAYKTVYGPAGQDLTTTAATPAALPPQVEVGIIAGTHRWLAPLSSLLLGGASDGRVSVESTRLDGMKDHISMPATHSFIMYHPSVKRQVIHFLKNGSFNRPQP